MRRIRFFVLALTLVFGLAACDETKNVAPLAERAIQALKARDMNALAGLVHPVKGLRFAPYASLNLETDRHFTAEELKRAPRDAKSHAWGTHDGSGEPIELSFNTYFDEFVYDRDFAGAEPLFNAAPPRKGNTPDNTNTVYPGAVAVTYHLPAHQANGMDWRNLRLVFEPYDGKWFLVHIVHDQWTI